MAYNQPGYSYASVVKMTEAISSIKKYKELSPNEFNPLDSIVEIYYTFGEFDQAEKNFKLALNINKNFYHSILYLGLVYLNTGKYNKALKTFKKLLKITSNRIEKATAYNMRANNYLDMGNNKKITEYYKKSLTESPFNLNAIEILNKSLLKNKDTTNSKNFLQMAYNRIQQNLETELLH